MPRITPESWKVLKSIFSESGFGNWRTKGDHLVGSKTGVIRPIVIPRYKDIAPEIIIGRLRTAKMSRERYFKLRKQCK